MSNICPVCQNPVEKDATKCKICDFSDNGKINSKINRLWLTEEDANHWLETVVKPYRLQWGAKKREAELLAQLEELRKKESKLGKEAKKRETELLTQLEEKNKKIIELEDAQKKEQALAPHMTPTIPISSPQQENFSHNTKVKESHQEITKRMEKNTKLGILGRIIGLLSGLFFIGAGVMSIWWCVSLIKHFNIIFRWLVIIPSSIICVAVIIYGCLVIIKGVFKGEEWWYSI